MRLKNTKIDGTNKDKIAGPPKFLKPGMLAPIVPKNHPIVKITANPPSILTGNFCKKPARRINNAKQTYTGRGTDPILI